MGEILVRPMETKDHPQEPIRVSCKNGANLLQTFNLTLSKIVMR